MTAGASPWLACALAALLVSLTAAQPFVEPIFRGPVSIPSDRNSSNRISNATIMGICTVAFLFVLFVTMTAIVCLRRHKQKEIDLAKPLILTEEVGKKKKRKDKKKSKAEELEEVELVANTASSTVTELPPRVVSTPTTLASDVSGVSPNPSDAEFDEDSTEESDISDSVRYTTPRDD